MLISPNSVRQPKQALSSCHMAAAIVSNGGQKSGHVLEERVRPGNLNWSFCGSHPINTKLETTRVIAVAAQEDPSRHYIGFCSAPRQVVARACKWPGHLTRRLSPAPVCGVLLTTNLITHKKILEGKKIATSWYAPSPRIHGGLIRCWGWTRDCQHVTSQASERRSRQT